MKTKSMFSAVVVVVLVAGLFSGDQVSGQQRMQRQPLDGLRGTVAPPIGPGGGGSTGGYSGPFQGGSRIEVQEFRTGWKSVGDLGISSTLETAWLVIRGMVKNELTYFFEKGPRDHRNRETMESLAGRNLYDLSITMADSSKAQTLITVPADGRSVTLLYRVPGNRMRFKAEVNNFFDPTITIDTTITIGLTLQPSGNPQEPLKVANAYIEFSNTKADVDGNIIHDLVKKFVEFIKGDDFDRKIESLVNGRRQDITNEAAKGVGLINRKLIPYTTKGLSHVQFGFDRSRQELLLRMSEPRPVVSGVSASR